MTEGGRETRELRGTHSQDRWGWGTGRWGDRRVGTEGRKGRTGALAPPPGTSAPHHRPLSLPSYPTAVPPTANLGLPPPCPVTGTGEGPGTRSVWPPPPGALTRAEASCPNSPQGNAPQARMLQRLLGRRPRVPTLPPGALPGHRKSSAPLRAVPQSFHQQPILWLVPTFRATCGKVFQQTAILFQA